MTRHERPEPFGIFLQARLGSTRLAEKVLLPLAGEPVVVHAMLSLKRCGAGVNLLLTDEESAARLRPHALRCGFELFAGASHDVLARFADALRSFPVERIVRATADNPLVSSELALRLLHLHRRNHADYSGYVGMPLGLGVEIVDAVALTAEYAEARDPYEREHVNPYLYRHPERFRVLRPRVPREYRLEAASVTLDTEEDYRYLCALYDELYRGAPIETHEVIEWLRFHPRELEAGGLQPGHEGAFRSNG